MVHFSLDPLIIDWETDSLALNIKVRVVLEHLPSGCFVVRGGETASEAWYSVLRSRPGEDQSGARTCLTSLGPVVRIGTNDLHINDPDFYQNITKSPSPFLKDPVYYASVGFPHAILGMVNPIEHRIRKQVLAPAFSPAQVQQISPLIQAKVENMCKIFEGLAKSSSPLNIAAAFKAYSMDVISELVIGEEFGALNSPGFRHEKLDIMKECIQGAWIARAFPTTAWVTLALPHWITKLFLRVPMIEVAMVRPQVLNIDL
jgi:hypothetical protein